MKSNELLMKAENTNGTVIFERDCSTRPEDLTAEMFIVTVKTRAGLDDCICRFVCYDPALQFFRRAAKESIYAQSVTIPIEQFMWMTAPCNLE